MVVESIALVEFSDNGEKLSFFFFFFVGRVATLDATILGEGYGFCRGSFLVKNVFN